MSQDFITRAELLAALNKIEDYARTMWHGEHDSVKSVKYEAKAEVCEELIALLKPVEPTIAQPERCEHCYKPGILGEQGRGRCALDKGHVGFHSLAPRRGT